MTANFCTLFNYRYAAKGLAMYQSLAKHCADFHLYVFAFDDQVFCALKEMNLNGMTVVSRQEFEDEKMLKAKATRTEQEYCWTCESLTIQYCLNHFPIDHCTYIDADMIFYSDPRVLIEEMGNDDVLLTEHRYAESTGYTGRFCVQFMTFKNTSNGRHILDHWCEQCLEWCYARIEGDRFGDQYYLEHWPEEYEGVHILSHRGGGVAPWNMKEYQFTRKNGSVWCRHIPTDTVCKLVFFHFHGLECSCKSRLIEFATCSKGYPLSWNTRWAIYTPYTKKLMRAARSFSNRTESLGAKLGEFGLYRFLRRSIGIYLLQNPYYIHRVSWHK